MVPHLYPMGPRLYPILMPHCSVYLPPHPILYPVLHRSQPYLGEDFQ
ncbi:hypothetical protein GGP72_000135 [Salinibacter ruber]|uniref:Uncharacterized protein n=1 Tax=Salinibacter ruber TaxID=146919 RepID=A0A9X2PWU0_9BACT|nr:hypothetical protein [Salinibacter ruber]MCS3679526.1 hypothetical protein [Salinibacter ruber]MCS4178467.1 hypothetical protein [Salinibacter ruber]